MEMFKICSPADTVGGLVSSLDKLGGEGWEATSGTRCPGRRGGSKKVSLGQVRGGFLIKVRGELQRGWRYESERSPSNSVKGARVRPGTQVVNKDA